MKVLFSYMYLMSIMPNIRFRSIPRSKYQSKRNISEFPYEFITKTNAKSQISNRFDKGRRQTNDFNQVKSSPQSYSPDTYITNYKVEVQKAINFLKKPKRKLEKLEFLEKISEKRLNNPSALHMSSDEEEVKKFIESLFLTEPSIYRKTVINAEKEAIDLITADKILQEAKKIVKNGIKKKSLRYELGGNIEEFWYQHISKYKIVRWDIFEDNFLGFLNAYIITDIGIIRKINWRKFLSKLFVKISKENKDYSLWILAPCYPSLPDATHWMISLSDWCSLILSDEFLFLLFSCIDEIPSLPIKKINDIQFQYACGCKFKGQWKGGIRQGTGMLELCSKETYSGIFNNGIFNDFGTLAGFGYLYKGCFNKEKFHSFGKITYPDMSYFEGIIEKGKLINGYLKWKDGKTYQGELKNNLLEGKGKMTAEGGAYWEGMWHQGKLYGEGVIRNINGQRLKGIFIDGAINNKGKLICDEYKYSGEFIESIPNGIGKLEFSNKNIYQGLVINGKPNGLGYMKYSSGDIYEGNFVNGDIVGQGKYYFSDGKIFQGQFVAGLPCGNGKFLFPDGDKLISYEGEVKNGIIEGYGEGIFRDGSSFKGEWSENTINGAGIWMKENITYEGDILNNLFHGFGVLKIDSSYYSGIWSCGKPNGHADARDFKENSYTGSFSHGLPTGRHKLEVSFLELLCTFRL